VESLVPSLTAYGISVNVPSGWDGRIYRRPPQPVQIASASVTQMVSPAVMHAANFALPADPGDFGGGAVEQLGPGNILLVLIEYPGSSGQTLFRARGIPIPLAAKDFDPAQLQRPRPGHVGLQRFFQTSGRAFCLYCVLFDQADRTPLVNAANGVLATVVVSP
jgi:hypothetical protein